MRTRSDCVAAENPRLCPKCGQPGEFRSEHASSHCVSCTTEARSAKSARSYARHREARKAKVAAYRKSNPEKVRALARKWERNNPEKHWQQREEERTRRGCRERVYDAHVKAWLRWQRKRPLLDDAHIKLWRSDANRMMAWRTRYNAAFCINCRMRTAIKKALLGNKRGRRWESLLGYTLDDLVRHLSKSVPKGYKLADVFGGRLHIDHIVPKSRFDVTTDEGLRAAWSLPNLQLLPARENMRKGAKVVTLL